MDIDDIWALGLLLECPEFDVRLITTTSNNTLIKAKIVAKFLEKAGRTDIPIGIGPSENRRKGPLFNWIKDYDLVDYPGQVHQNGAEVLCSTIIDSHKPITLIGIGPLGTIASALKVNPNITKNARFVGMQGSVRIGYGGTPNQHPEYNVIQNIQACKDVFQAPWEKTITPLDTCGNIILSGENFKRFMMSDSLIVNLIKENSEIWAYKLKKRSLINEQKTSILFDTVAIYLGFAEDLLNIEELKIEVTDKGITIISENGNTIRCATSWKDEKAFKKFVVDRLVA
jgi:inosine-uridine nucleoside N-ribohydrolase